MWQNMFWKANKSRQQFRLTKELHKHMTSTLGGAEDKQLGKMSV